MGDEHMVYKLLDDNGSDERWIEGERYRTLAVATNAPGGTEEDGKEYLVITVRYANYARGARRTKVKVLYRRERVEERQSLDFETLPGMFAEVPWRLPEAVLPPVRWLRECVGDASRNLPRAWVLHFDVWIVGPYHPGGDEFLMLEFSEGTRYASAIKAQLQRVPVTLLPADDTCPICLEMFDGSVVRTRCSHLFHHRCLVVWLFSTNSCPSCRRTVVV